MIEAWGAGECAGESCGPARLPQSRGAAVCELDEAALSEAAGGPAGCRIAAQPSALLGPMSTTVPRGPAATPTRRSRGWQTLAAPDNELGRRLFPSSLRGSLPPWCSKRAGEDSCGAGTASAEAFRKTRILLCGAPAAAAKRAVEQRICAGSEELVQRYIISLQPKSAGHR